MQSINSSIKVEVLNYTPLHIASYATRTCWDSHDKSDTKRICKVCKEDLDNEKPYSCCVDADPSDIICGKKDRELIERVGNKFKHESIKNHCTITFDIKGISTKTLLALTRHQVGTNFSVQSTRYTTSKTVKNGMASYTNSRSEKVNNYLKKLNEMIKDCVESNISNDDISMLLPQAWKYNLVCSMSIQALQHFLRLRLKKDAHYDIQNLAFELYNALPLEYKYLFNDCFPEPENGAVNKYSLKKIDDENYIYVKGEPNIE